MCIYIYTCICFVRVPVSGLVLRAVALRSWVLSCWWITAAPTWARAPRAGAGCSAASPRSRREGFVGALVGGVRPLGLFGGSLFFFCFFFFGGGNFEGGFFGSLLGVWGGRSLWQALLARGAVLGSHSLQSRLLKRLEDNVLGFSVNLFSGHKG